MCEATWVFLRSYRLGRHAVADAFRGFLRTPTMVFDDPDAVHRAIDSFSRRKGDLADFLLREDALAAGCDTVVTFDRDLLEERGFSGA